MKMKLQDALAILVTYNVVVLRSPLSDEEFATYRRAYGIVQAHAAAVMKADRPKAPPQPQETFVDGASSVAAIRFRLGLSQTDLAERAGVDLATVWRWENQGIPGRGLARAYLEGLAREAQFPGLAASALRGKGDGK